MKIISKEQLLAISTPIMQGLLASGQYTNAWDGMSEPTEETIVRDDNGKHWERFTYRRHTALVVHVAMSLTHELIECCEYEECRMNE